MEYLQQLQDLIRSVEFSRQSELPRADYDFGIEQMAGLFKTKREEKARVFFIGNGGSAAIAGHMTADYLKNGAMRVCSLYNASVLTCLGNDYGYEFVFSKQLEMMMEKGDLLVAISSSGNSPNIIRAIQTAHELGGMVITLTGFSPENTARMLGDVNLYVPSNSYGMVESLHNLMLQQIVDELMKAGGEL